MKIGPEKRIQILTIDTFANNQKSGRRQLSLSYGPSVLLWVTAKRVIMGNGQALYYG